MNYSDLLAVVKRARGLIARLDGAVDDYAPVEDLRRLAEEYAPSYADEVANVAGRLDSAIDHLADWVGVDSDQGGSA